MPDVNDPIGEEVFGFICQELFTDYLETVIFDVIKSS